MRVIKLLVILSSSVFLLLTGKGVGIAAQNHSSFSDSQIIGVDNSPTQAIADDFNNDGYPDIASIGVDSISLILGHDDGTFSAPINSNWAPAIYSESASGVVAGDFNGDGLNDLAVSDFTSGYIWVVLGNGDGTFNSPKAIGTGTLQSIFLVKADFNKDGKMDLASLGFSFGQVTLGTNYGNGNGTFTLSTLDVSSSLRGLAVGDFNEDGSPDLLASSLSGSPSLFFNNNGRFLFETHSSANIGCCFSIAADLNNDGHFDIVSSGANQVPSNTMNVAWGDGTGQFTSNSSSYLTGLFPFRFVASDFNQDGISDLAITDANGEQVHSISVLDNKGDSSFSVNTPLSLPDTVGPLVTADFNGDGSNDLAAGMLSSDGQNNKLAIFLNNTKHDINPPLISSHLSPSSNTDGWNNADVTVSFSCSDDIAIASCSGPTTLTGEGANQTVTGTATDTSGNTASATATVNIDRTAPAINYTVSQNPNVNDWNTGDATVTFNCNDALSGVDTCTSPVTLSTEGGGQTVTGTATDKAGNTKTITATVNIDKSAPTITYLETPAPNINGWNQDNVTISFLCDDSVSGIDTCSAPVTVSAEGANQTVTGTAIDKAGNSSTVTATVNLDKTAPTINSSATPATNSNGWNNFDVVVLFTCDDALSGIDSCSGPTTVSSEGANQSVTGTATDKAGNTSTTTATVSIDKTAPTITASVSPAPNSDGWNNSDTTVSFTCSDSLSGIDVCPSPVKLTEGAGQIITGTATDKAGNSASTSVMVNIDKTAPVVSSLSWLSNPLQQGQNTTLMATVTDGLSGVKSVTYSVNGGTPQPMTYDPISGNYIVTFGSSMAANTYNISVFATDMADNGSLGTNDVLAVYTTANGYVNGHAKTLPTATDVLPISKDTSNSPAKLVMGFTNVTAPMSGSFDLDYAVKNKQDEFSLSSTSISWVVVQDSTHSSILGRADLTTYVNGAKAVTASMTVRYDITLGTNGSPDHVSVKIFNPGDDPNTGTPAYTISDDVEANGSNLMIHP